MLHCWFAKLLSSLHTPSSDYSTDLSFSRLCLSALISSGHPRVLQSSSKPSSGHTHHITAAAHAHDDPNPFRTDLPQRKSSCMGTGCRTDCRWPYEQWKEDMNILVGSAGHVLKTERALDIYRCRWDLAGISLWVYKAASAGPMTGGWMI